MVERALGMCEVPGSIPGISRTVFFKLRDTIRYNPARMTVGTSATWGCSPVLERTFNPRHLQKSIFQNALPMLYNPARMTDGTSTTWGPSSVVERVLGKCEAPCSIPRHLHDNVFSNCATDVVQPR